MGEENGLTAPPLHHLHPVSSTRYTATPMRAVHCPRDCTAPLHLEAPRPSARGRHGCGTRTHGRSLPTLPTVRTCPVGWRVVCQGEGHEKTSVGSAGSWASIACGAGFHIGNSEPAGRNVTHEGTPPIPHEPIIFASTAPPPPVWRIGGRRWIPPPRGRKGTWMEGQGVCHPLVPCLPQVPPPGIRMACPAASSQARAPLWTRGRVA